MDIIHPNAEGHRLIAELNYRTLSKGTIHELSMDGKFVLVSCRLSEQDGSIEETLLVDIYPNPESIARLREGRVARVVDHLISVNEKIAVEVERVELRAEV